MNKFDVYHKGYNYNKQQLRNLIPDGSSCKKSKIDKELVEKVNEVLKDETERDGFRDNLIGLTKVMGKGRFQLKEYVNAVRYINLMMLGKNITEAYRIVFQDRVIKQVENGKSDHWIDTLAKAYNKGKLVNLVREAAMIPVYIYNADVFQEAISTTAELMRYGSSDRIRLDAANNLLTHLKRPEEYQLDVDVNISGNDNIITALEETTKKLREQQKRILNQGMSVKDIAESNIIEGEFKDVN